MMPLTLVAAVHVAVHPMAAAAAGLAVHHHLVAPMGACLMSPQQLQPQPLHPASYKLSHNHATDRGLRLV